MAWFDFCIENFIHKLCDKNGDGRLSTLVNVNGQNYNEIGLFNEALSSYNEEKGTFVIEDTEYSIDDVPRPKIPYDIDYSEKNDATRVDNTCVLMAATTTTTRNVDKDIHISKTVNGKQVDFTYNQADLEDYIINHAKDSQGHKITKFKEINNIRNKPESERTNSEQALLEEFDSMIKYAINAGVDYGVDPKLILSIIQREVGFNGLSKDVVGGNGKGYMQITSAVPADILARPEVFGPEAEELLKSRGFDINCPKSERAAMVKKIMKYLTENKDPDFNIRMGTLALRYQLNKANGNVEVAARNYNASKSKYAYGKAVKGLYNDISSHSA